MRIAIVNDMALAREVLRRLIVSIPGYAVAWMAENGEEAVRKAAQDRPDIILMDLIMPVLDGVEATRRIMAQSPCPILLVTSSVSGNFNKVYEAMGCGGLDAVNTPTLAAGGQIKDAEGLLARIAKLAKTKNSSASGIMMKLPAVVTATPPARSTEAPAVPALVAIGASTGGPEALAQVLSALPASFPASVMIIQHIAVDFAPSLARWLQGRSSLPVKLAQNGDEPTVGQVLLAGTDDHLILRADRKLAYVSEPASYPYRPSVDVFFASLATHWPRPGTAVLLTGMGSDGARGLLGLRKAGWHTIAQDQATCVVYGMPKAAADLLAACATLPLPQIGEAVRARG